MSLVIPGVISRRANVVTLNANVANTESVYVSSLAASNVIVTDSNKQLVSSNVTHATLAFLNGVTSSIQGQLDTKMDVGGSVATIVANSITVSNLLTMPGQVASRALVTDAAKNLVTSAVTATELGYLSGVTSAVQTQLNAKQANVTGAATTIVASDLTASRALASDGSGKVAVSSTTSAELGYLSGVTSAVQTQLNAKQANVTGAATTIVSSDLTASRALTSDGSGKVAVSNVTATELGYLSGVTSAIQTQLGGKQATVTGAAATVVAANLTAARVVVSDANGQLGNSLVTTTTLGYLDATSSVQGQLNAKQANITGAAATVTTANLTAARVVVSDANGQLGNSLVTTTTLSYLDATSSIQTQLNAKQATIVGAASSVVTANLGPSTVVIADANGKLTNAAVTATTLGYLDATSSVQTQLNAKQATIVGAASSVVTANLGPSTVVIADGSGKLTNAAVTATTLGYLDATSSVQTQLNAKQATIVGAASSVVTANLGPSTVVIADGSGKLANSAVTATTLGYLDATSSVQTQLNDKQANVTGAATTIVSSNLTASRALASDGSGKVAVSTVTAAELGYLTGVTSNVQTQLDAKAALAGATFTGSVVVQGNLTVMGNTTSLDTDQLVVEDPVVVINSSRIASPTGLYMMQNDTSNLAVLYQNGNIELISTPTAANSASYTATTYLPLHCGPLTATAALLGNTALVGKLTVTPPAATDGYMTSMSGAYDVAAATHTISAASMDATSGGTGIFSGQLMVFVTNGATDGTNKTGCAIVSLIKSPPDFDVVPVSVHRNVNLTTFDVAKSTAGSNVIIVTDSDCSVSWKFEGATVRA